MNAEAPEYRVRWKNCKNLAKLKHKREKGNLGEMEVGEIDNIR